MTSRRRSLRALPLVAALAATGCATHPYQAAMPDLGGTCVARLGDIQAIPLRYRDANDKKPAPYVEFAQLARCYRPADGQAEPVALYGLQGIAAPARVHVEVLLSTGGTFAAALDTLDANRQPLAHYAFDRFVRRGAQYSLDVFLNAGDTAPAYLMLRPDPQQVGKLDTTIGSADNMVPVGGAGVMWMYHNGVETSAIRPLLQGGQLVVTVEPETAPVLGTK